MYCVIMLTFMWKCILYEFDISWHHMGNSLVQVIKTLLLVHTKYVCYAFNLINLIHFVMYIVCMEWLIWWNKRSINQSNTINNYLCLWRAWLWVWLWVRAKFNAVFLHIVIHFPLSIGWSSMTCDVDRSLNNIHSFIHCEEPQIDWCNIKLYIFK